jgi:hypothetical protein
MKLVGAGMVKGTEATSGEREREWRKEKHHEYDIYREFLIAHCD